MKRSVGFFLALLLLITLFPLPVVATEEFTIITNRAGSTVLQAYNGNGGVVHIPDGVTMLERDVFRDNTDITSVVMPDSVTFMGDGVFFGCTNLVSVKLSQNLTNISKGSFYECVSLESIAIPDSVTKIGSSAFMNCDSLEVVFIPDSVTRIDGNAFYKCDALAEVYVGDGCETIDTRAFTDCTSLATITLGSGLTSISDSAFSGVGTNDIRRTYYAEPGTYAQEFILANSYRFVAKGGVVEHVDSFAAPTDSVWLAMNPTAVTVKVEDYVYDGNPDSYNNFAAVPHVQTVVGADGVISVMHRTASDVATVIISEYTHKLEFIRTLKFTKEFPDTGAFTKDDNGNFYIFYAKSVGKDEYNVTNMMMVKYSPSGQKMKQTSPSADYDGNPSGVRVPYYAGSFRMEIANQMVAVYGGREMFNGHQASFGFAFDLDTLQLVQTVGKGRTMSFPYVSHSFNQFILPIAKGFVVIDHGDANPRGFVVGDIEKNVVGNASLLLMDFYNLDPGITTPSLYNQTFAEMGGIAETADGYIFAGTYDKSRPTEGRRNLFVITMSRDLSTSNAPIWLTNYTDADVNSPKIVRIGSDEYLLLWRANGKTFKLTIDGKGKMLTAITEIPMVTISSDDVLRYNPVSGLVHWAVPGGNGGITLYTLDPHGPLVGVETAKPISSRVTVNGVVTEFDAYTINGNNYFKLRDLAYVLGETDKRFSIDWDPADNSITLGYGKVYSPVGGEMQGKGGGNKVASPTTSKVYMNGKPVYMTAYNIGGNNYFKLRDVGLLFDFGVSWDNDSRTVVIETSKLYTE